jgi:hypothetical protein
VAATFRDYATLLVRSTALDLGPFVTLLTSAAPVPLSAHSG